MSSLKKIKGYAFEWLVRNILKACGFKEVKPYGEIIYKGSQGIMIHGLGQPHNADVLMLPPFQIPFYFPSRILVECKCYDDKIGLPIIRGAHGLREDINGFEVLTPELLKERRNYRRKKTALYDLDRYQYQVAVASLTGFKRTAQEYAITHKIPLISFDKSKIYSRIREFIDNLDDEDVKQLDDDDFKILINYFKEKKTKTNISNNQIPEVFHSFIQEANHIFKNTFVGVLENGTIIFMYLNKKEKEYPNNNKIEFGKLTYTCTIHWSSEYNNWSIKEENSNNSWEFQFELPNKLFDFWAQKDFNSETALDLKEQYFKKIFVFGNKTHSDIPSFFILELSKTFINEARKNLINNE